MPKSMLIDAPVTSLHDLTTAISTAAFGPLRPAPRNLDGLADLLRETQVSRVIVPAWCLDEDAAERVMRVFDDLGVDLVR